MNIDNKASRKVHFLSMFHTHWVLLLRMAVRFFLLRTLPSTFVLKFEDALFYQCCAKISTYSIRKCSVLVQSTTSWRHARGRLTPLVQYVNIQNEWKSRKTLSGMQENCEVSDMPCLLKQWTIFDSQLTRHMVTAHSSYGQRGVWIGINRLVSICKSSCNSMVTSTNIYNYSWKRVWTCSTKGLPLILYFLRMAYSKNLSVNNWITTDTIIAYLSGVFKLVFSAYTVFLSVYGWLCCVTVKWFKNSPLY